MNPQEAINLLDTVTGQVQASREVHIKVQQAVDVLRHLAAETETKNKENK